MQFVSPYWTSGKVFKRNTNTIHIITKKQVDQCKTDTISPECNGINEVVMPSSESICNKCFIRHAHVSPTGGAIWRMRLKIMAVDLRKLHFRLPWRIPRVIAPHQDAASETNLCPVENLSQIRSAVSKEMHPKLTYRHTDIQTDGRTHIHTNSKLNIHHNHVGYNDKSSNFICAK